MRHRDINSRHQAFMKAFFGKEAKNYQSDWHTWPDPYKQIYSRMLAAKMTIVPWDVAKKAKKALEVLKDIEPYLDNIKGE